jgi:hypothetical protein
LEARRLETRVAALERLAEQQKAEIDSLRMKVDALGLIKDMAIAIRARAYLYRL